VTSLPPYLGDFSDDDLEWLAGNGEQRHVSVGQAIIREGVPAEDVFVILDGSFVATARRLSVPLERRLGPGEIVGEMSYVAHSLPTATVRAVVDSVVLRIARSRLDRKIAEDAGFARRFHKVVSEFLVDRMRGWKGAHGAGQTRPEDSLANLRVHELIEKMLRGDFPLEFPEPQVSREDAQGEGGEKGGDGKDGEEG
jgi:CRP/FNR family transcriptional regulator, cyclic AMP receptor protein